MSNDPLSNSTTSPPSAGAMLAGSFRLTLSHNSSYAYAARLATTPKDLQAAQALRYKVFNLELGEGLPQSASTQLDADPFDEVCDHLIAEDMRTGEIVGTYRLQSGRHAAEKKGYYCSQEFDLSPYEPLRGQLIELGRACVAKSHRNLLVLQLLWRGIAFYARTHGARYLIGCSSIHSQDPEAGAALYSSLVRKHLAPIGLQTTPKPEVACPMGMMSEEAPEAPRLLGAYLALGAWICGPPALDQEFKTIDFLTLLDLQSLPKRSVEKFLR